MPPCHGLRPQNWLSLHTIALQCLSEQANRAAKLGWTTEELFGVRPEVGAVRVDAWGALIISGGKPVVSVEPNRISFGVSSYYRIKSRPPSVPVWDWRELKKRP
jgi:hypothetical protein